MLCPKCGCLQDKVVDSRVSKEGDCIRRRRECIECHQRFSTHEEIVRIEHVIVKRDGTREDYKPEKLRSGIQHACWKRQISQAQIDKMVMNVTNELHKRQEREVSSDDIGKLVMAELHDVDRVAYIRFASVYRKFKDVDDFIDEVQSLKT